MTKNNFFGTVGGIFAVIAALHFLRIIYGWSAIVGGFEVPLWASYVACPVAAYLSYLSFRFRGR